MGKWVHFIWLLLTSFPVKQFPNIFSSLLTQTQMKTTNNKAPGQKAAFGLQQSRDTCMKWYHFSLLKQFPLYLDNPKSFRPVGNWLERQLGPSAYGNLQALPRSWSSTSPSSYFVQQTGCELQFQVPPAFHQICSFEAAIGPWIHGTPPQTWGVLLRRFPCSAFQGPLWQSRPTLPWRSLPHQTYSRIIWNLSLLFSSLQDNVLQLFCPSLEDRRLFSNS